MRRLGDRLRTQRRPEGGWTLVELLVALTIGMVVMGGAVTIVIGAAKSEPRAGAKVDAIQEGRMALERITREVRQGVEAESPSSSRLSLITYVKHETCSGAAAGTAIPCLVTYNCAAGACTRTVAQPDGSSPGATAEVVRDLTSSAVFSYAPGAEDPDYVGVQLSFLKTQATGPVVLADGATLRSGGAQ